MSRPLIGVTSYAREGEEIPVFSLPAAYVDRLREAGGVPVILPAGGDDPEILLDHIDGLLLAGGGDVAPSAYGAEMHETVYSVSEERDRFEFALLRAALNRRAPIFCICRGMQVLNVVCGGTLHVHVPERLGEDVPHRIPPRLTCRHPVRVAKDSRLFAVVRREELNVCSWHHQGIDSLGQGLRPVAWAPDGLIEAVEHSTHPWCIGVQWHPEMDGADQTQSTLFRALVEEAVRALER